MVAGGLGGGQPPIAARAGHSERHTSAPVRTQEELAAGQRRNDADANLNGNPISQIKHFLMAKTDIFGAQPQRKPAASVQQFQVQHEMDTIKRLPDGMADEDGEERQGNLYSELGELNLEQPQKTREPQVLFQVSNFGIDG